KLTDRQRFDWIERRTKERTAACEKDGLRCRIAPFFEGKSYFEIAQLEINDVRLVYAPGKGIGNFGGETDNWQWPRHTGDFGFFRAYVGKDGKPASFSKDNVPYRPKHWLTVSRKGASPGDLVFVAGYPGRTQRHETYPQVRERTQWTLPRAIRRAKEQLTLLEEITKGDKALEIKAEQRKRGLNNGLTKNVGVLDGLVRGGLLAKKEAQERDLVAWIAADKARQAEYGEILPALQTMQVESEKSRERNAVLAALNGPSSLLATADILHRLSLERPKKDMDREPAFQERNWSRIREALERMEKTYDPRLDRTFLRFVLVEAATLPADQRIAPLDAAVGLTAGIPAAQSAKAIDAWLDAAYPKATLGDKAVRLAFFTKPAAAFVASPDPFVKLAIALHPLHEAVQEKEKSDAGKRSLLRPRYMRALLAKEGGLVAPDANSTLRVTYGTVKGVSPRDGMTYLPQTTLQGIVEKQTGTGEFDAPKAELDAIRALRGGKGSPYVDPKLKDVPVDYLSDVDSTGGNSGSATLNSKNQLVGLLFDGTFDTVASDFLFDREKTRSIHVDSRYLLWVMTQVDGATNVLEEMKLD
ncbi:MAG TPA: S46 family peptidase, partial [Thermoanaerobaculia bacterium]